MGTVREVSSSRAVSWESMGLGWDIVGDLRRYRKSRRDCSMMNKRYRCSLVLSRADDAVYMNICVFLGSELEVGTVLYVDVYSCLD